MHDPFEAHAYFALMFACITCQRVMPFDSDKTEFTDEWFRELAARGKSEGWFVPPPDEAGSMDVMTAWCPACGAKLFSGAASAPSKTALEPRLEGGAGVTRAFRLACTSGPRGSAFGGIRSTSSVMNDHDDYIAGPHHYGIHFGCGLVFGAGAGTWIGWKNFDSGWPIAVTAIAISLGTAFISGRWGDRGWHWVLHKLGWFS